MFRAATCHCGAVFRVKNRKLSGSVPPALNSGVVSRARLPAASYFQPAAFSIARAPAGSKWYSCATGMSRCQGLLSGTSVSATVPRPSSAYLTSACLSMLIAIAVRTVSFRRSGLLYPFLNWEYAARICGVMIHRVRSDRIGVRVMDRVRDALPDVLWQDADCARGGIHCRKGLVCRDDECERVRGAHARDVRRVGMQNARGLLLVDLEREEDVGGRDRVS